MGMILSKGKCTDGLPASRLLLAFVLFATWLLAAVGPAGADTLTATAFRVAGDANQVRIVMEFDSERAALVHAACAAPAGRRSAAYRIRLDLADLKSRGLLANVRLGHVDENVFAPAGGGERTFLP